MMKFKRFSLIVLAFSFLIAPLAAQTAPPAAQTTEVAQQAAVTNAPPAQQAQQAAQEKEKELQQKQRDDEQLRLYNARMKKIEAEQYEMEGIVKTYSLKYVNPSDLMRAAKFYVYDSTSSGSTLTVKIARKYVDDFEALLKKMDVEKKNIQFRVYTIIGMKDAPADAIKSNFVMGTRDISNSDLKLVLEQMKDLWNFKYYSVDNPSFLTVKDGAEGNSTKLVSGSINFDSEMRLRNVELRGDEPGKRIIAVREIQLIQTLRTPNGLERTPLIETSDITFKEKGYLVVGVSGLQAGLSGAALILVISAEVK
jgi:hypothetical protein